jgi:uncharacterized membrane protein YfcA
VHGVYATGGPPLVYALSRVELDKTALRATLCAIWIVIDSALTVAFVLDGRFGEGGWAAPIVMFPSMVVAIGLGSWIHGRIDPVRFRLAVYVLLIVLASSLVFRG